MIARALVTLTSASEDRALLLADLEERFGAVAERRGPSAARRWYWSQAVRGVVVRLRPDADLLAARSWQGTLGDLRTSVRSLTRRPLYVVGVVGTLALGLASAVAVTSVAWHVWLSPLPFPDPDRVVRVYELEAPDPGTGPAGERVEWRISPPLLEEMRAHAWSTIDAVAGVSSNVVDWNREDRTARLEVLRVSPELFGILGVRPLVGRTLSADPDVREVVLTEPFWTRVFGGDPGVTDGGALELNGERHAIVGVVAMPSGYPDRGEVVAHLSFDAEQLVDGMRGARYLDVVARVDPEIPVADAAAELDRFVATLGEVHAAHDGWGATAVALSEELVEPYRGVLGLLTVAGVLFLVLAVVNVAGLVAARTVEGRTDRAVRLALGASERRLLRAGIVESLLLGGVAAAAALALAAWMLGPLVALAPAEVPRIDRVRLGSGLAATLVSVALAAGAGVGALGYVLSRGVRAPAIGRSPGRPRNGMAGRGALVTAQVALTTLLATAGVGVLGQMLRLQSVDVGFDPSGVVQTQVILSTIRYPSPEARLVYWRTVVERGEARGIEIAVGTNSPMTGMNMPWGFRVDPTDEQAFAQYHPVSAAYFDVLGIALLEGRTFDGGDRAGSARVVVVNEALAGEFFPGESPVGRELLLLNEPTEIVGVVASTRHRGPDEDAPPEIYAPIEHDPWPHAQVLVRGDTSTTGVLSELLDDIDPALGVPPPAPYARYVAEWFASLRLQLVIVGVLGVVGVLLATLGLYALVAYRVQARRREFGVRMALGATDARMVVGVVGQGARLAAAGLALGFAAWYIALPLWRPLLGEAGSGGAGSALVVSVLVGAVALVACAVPALRSTAVDPAVTLRSE